MELLKKICDETVDKNFDELWEIASYIHANPEIGFKEEKACKVLSSFLEKKGFEVEVGLKELPTSFKAVFKKGQGPRIAVFAEYDALPELGHACGHNLIATSALGCAIAVKEALESSDFDGSIEVYGTPAEENGGGKIIMLDNGVFNGLDAVFLMHPTSAMTRIGGECASFSEYIIEYHGKSAHAESHPENGVNAGDAAVLCYQAIGLLRQQLKDNIHICVRISHFGTDIGQIPAYSRIETEISATSKKDIEQSEKKLKNIAEGMALATGCSMNLEYIPGYLGRIPNQILADVCKKELKQLEEPTMEGIPSDKGGEDLGNVSYHIPICNLYATIYPDKKISGHTVEFRELAISDNGKHCISLSSKAMSRSIMTLLKEPSLLEKAKEELKMRLKEQENE